MAIENEQLASGGGGGGAETGSVITYTADTPPDGYFLCDGTTLSRTTYADLYAIIGDSFGNGDGVTTFQIPDFRGKFLRGTDKGAGNDPDSLARISSGTGGNIGDNVGSAQANENKSHRHYNGRMTTNSNQLEGIYGGTYANWGNHYFYQNVGFTANGFQPWTQTVGGSESRPINVNINYMIKY